MKIVKKLKKGKDDEKTRLKWRNSRAGMIFAIQTRAASGIFEALWYYAARSIEAKLFLSKWLHNKQSKQIYMFLYFELIP